MNNEYMLVTRGQLNKIFNNAYRLIEEAISMHNESHFPTACFLAITSIEEAAKFRIHGKQYIEDKPITQNILKMLRYGNGQYKAHILKHIIGIIAGLSGNPHTIKLYGKTFAATLKNMATTGKIFDIRNDCLYIDRKNNKITYPNKNIKGPISSCFIGCALEVLSDCCRLLATHSKNGKASKGYACRHSLILKMSESFASQNPFNARNVNWLLSSP